MERSSKLVHVAPFCGQCDCGCPELFLDPDAAPDKRVIITDDFGQRIQMSVDQFTDLVEQASRGLLAVVEPVAV